MKSSERFEKLKDLSDDELEDRREQMAEEAFRLRFQWAMGQAEALKKQRELRKDRARVMTLIRERELAREEESRES